MRKRRSVLPILTLALFSWTALIYTLNFIPPDSNFIIAVFLFLVFIALFFTFSLVLKNSYLGFLISLFLTSYLFLRTIKMDNFLNLILLLSLTLTIGFYLKQK